MTFFPTLPARGSPLAVFVVPLLNTSILFDPRLSSISQHFCQASLDRFTILLSCSCVRNWPNCIYHKLLTHIKRSTSTRMASTGNGASAPVPQTSNPFSLSKGHAEQRKTKICVYCGASPGNKPEHMESARQLARVMAANNIELGESLILASSPRSHQIANRGADNIAE